MGSRCFLPLARSKGSVVWCVFAACVCMTLLRVGLPFAMLLACFIATVWQHSAPPDRGVVGGWLEGGWGVVGGWLEGGWRVVGGWLEGGWRVVGGWLEGGWRVVGGWLEGGWRVVGVWLGVVGG